MPTQSEPSAQSTPLPLPPVKPQGGSKWAAQFSGPRQTRLSHPALATAHNATVSPDGKVSEAATKAEIRQTAVFLLSNGAKIRLGDFLTGPLTLAVTAAAPETALCGAPLTPRQSEILSKLGRLRSYISITAVQSFSSVTTATAEPTQGPGPHIRPLAQHLRAPKSAEPSQIAILPTRETEKFCLTNRASLTAWLRAKRVTIIDPNAIRLSELTSSLAAAALVILADPSEAGLLGLCHPGTKILEIAPEGWLGAHTRVISDLFSLNWTPFLATPPTYSLLTALPFGNLVPCSYEVPIRELSKTLDMLAS